MLFNPMSAKKACAIEKLLGQQLLDGTSFDVGFGPMANTPEFLLTHLTETVTQGFFQKTNILVDNEY